MVFREVNVVQLRHYPGTCL